MPFTNTCTYSTTYNKVRYEWSDNQSAGERHVVSESIPDSSTDLSVNWTADVSEIKSLLIVSDYAITVETNSGASPANTITLVAGEPVIWTAGMPGAPACPLTTDVTGLFITNASGSAALLTIKMIQDPTP